MISAKLIDEDGFVCGAIEIHEDDVVALPPKRSLITEKMELELNAVGFKLLYPPDMKTIELAEMIGDSTGVHPIEVLDLAIAIRNMIPRKEEIDGIYS